MKRWVPGVGQVAFEDGNGKEKPWEELTKDDINVLKAIIKREKRGCAGGGTTGG